MIKIGANGLQPLCQRDAYSQYRALAFKRDTDCDQHRTANHAGAMADLLTGVELGKRSVAQRLVAPFLKLLVQQPGGTTDLGTGNLKSAKRF